MSCSFNKTIFKFLFLLPCLALAQYPKAMDFSKLYQGKLDSVAVIHRTGWTKETSWPEAPEEEHITEERKLLSLSKGKRLLKILQDKTVYKEEYPLLNDVVSSFLFYIDGKEVLTLNFSTATKQLTMYRGDELIFAGMSKGKLTKKLIRYLYPKLSAKELYMNFFILWEEI
jgi:hypothetical protein